MRKLALFLLVSCVFISPFLSHADTSDDWSTPQEIVRLSAGQYWHGDSPSIAFDQFGVWHLVYGYAYHSPDPTTTTSYSAIRYINSRGESKDIVKVETPFSVSYPSIAIDPTGGLHLVYLGGSYASGYSIRYMNNAQGYWSNPQQLTGPIQIWFDGNPSIAFDPSGTWHLVYSHAYYTTTHYSAISYINSRLESKNLVEAPYPSYATHPAIAVDPNGGLHVVYRGSLVSLMYMNNVSGSWSTPQELVRLSARQVWFSGSPSFTFDKEGNWHLVYGYGYYTPDFAAFYLGIRYTNSKNESKTLLEAPYPSLRVSNPSIAADPAGGLHVVYHGSLWSIMYMNKIRQVSLELLDGSDFSAGREVSSNPQDLASGGTSVTGAVTDGVTRLLLRLTTDKPQTVTFSLQGTGNPQEDGILRSIDGFQQGSSITITTTELNSKQYAFAIYQAPENFTRQNYPEDKTASQRNITLKIDYGSSIPLQQEIKLTRPPIVLIHGLWSSRKMWLDSEFANRLKLAIPGIYIVPADYSANNASHFEVNKEVVYNWITIAKDRFRSHKIAMVQADVLGHSMGGLLARIWAGTKVYESPKNFGKGTINKLITLDSPHFGSFFADAGIACLLGQHSLKADVIFWIMETTGHSLTKGAVGDMMTTSGPISMINRTKIVVPSHAIAGVYTNYSIQTYTGPNGELRRRVKGLPSDYFNIHNMLEEEGYGIIPYIIDGSDLVVSSLSQIGGLFSAYHLFMHHHMGATTQDVVNKTIELLNADIDSSLFNLGFLKTE